MNKSQLRQIIREELKSALNENNNFFQKLKRLPSNLRTMNRAIEAAKKNDLQGVKVAVNTTTNHLSGKEKEKKQKELYGVIANSIKNQNPNMAAILTQFIKEELRSAYLKGGGAMWSAGKTPRSFSTHPALRGNVRALALKKYIEATYKELQSATEAVKEIESLKEPHPNDLRDLKDIKKEIEALTREVQKSAETYKLLTTLAHPKYD